MQRVHELFDRGGVRRAQLRGIVLEKVTDLVGCDYRHAEADEHPKQVTRPDPAPCEVEDRRVERNPRQARRDDIKERIPETAPTSVQGQ